METVVRVVLIYVFILVGLRLLGKREFSQLSAIDLVTLLLVPEIVSQAITRDDFSLTNAFVAVATLFCLVFFTSALAHRFRRVERFINGAPALLVARGKILFANCDRERISAEEIFSEMHKNGLDSLEAVRWAILEVDGRISIVPEK
ncbi:MAG TPA: YetF domain-containing protein [Opitutus sp.]|jgi:uncharacterized membrane protein YcaP (DUF421 family)|nr:YetF domain-containing protein [Opitutus sp.]